MVSFVVSRAEHEKNALDDLICGTVCGSRLKSLSGWRTNPIDWRADIRWRSMTGSTPRIVLVVLIAVAISAAAADAQEASSPAAARLVAVPRRADQPPTLDGKLDDPIWRDTQPITHFVQRNPVEGAPASEATEVYLAYDSSCIYVAFYAHYSDPGLIRANRVDRDRIMQDDTMSVFFDTFHDQQSAFVFSVNGYGVQ